jgi:hypothetical protein
VQEDRPGSVRLRRAALITTAAAAALLAVAAGPGQARADEETPVAEALKAAEDHWRDLDYDLVIVAADKAISLATTDAERSEALRYKASALVVLGQTADAEAAFARIFTMDPEYELPEGTSPRVLAVFGPARARWLVGEQKRLATELGESLAALDLKVQLPVKPFGGRPLPVKIQLTDPGHIGEAIVLSYRRAPDKHFSTLIETARAGETTLTIPESFTASAERYSLELYVRVRHASGLTLRQEGDPEHAITISVGPGQVPKPTPWYRTWWFYGSATLVGALGITVLVLALPAGPQRIEIMERP